MLGFLFEKMTNIHLFKKKLWQAEKNNFELMLKLFENHVKTLLKEHFFYFILFYFYKFLIYAIILKILIKIFKTIT